MERCMEETEKQFKAFMMMKYRLENAMDAAENHEICDETSLVWAKNNALLLYADYKACKYRNDELIDNNAHNLDMFNTAVDRIKNLKTTGIRMKYGMKVICGKTNVMNLVEACRSQIEGYHHRYTTQRVLLTMMHIRILQICQFLGVALE